MTHDHWSILDYIQWPYIIRSPLHVLNRPLYIGASDLAIKINSRFQRYIHNYNQSPLHGDIIGWFATTQRLLLVDTYTMRYTKAYKRKQTHTNARKRTHLFAFIRACTL